MVELDLSRYPVAQFHGFEDFPHFGNPDHPDCFCCNSRLLKCRPLLVTEECFLTPMTPFRKEDRQFVIIDGLYTLFTRKHITSYMDLPDNWTGCQKQALAQLELPERAFNISSNSGFAAGERMGHPHDWIIPRGYGEDGLLCEDTGWATVLLLIKQLGITAG